MNEPRLGLINPFVERRRVGWFDIQKLRLDHRYSVAIATWLMPGSDYAEVPVQSLVNTWREVFT